MSGYIKLHRKLTEWEWYKDIPVRILFEHLLLTANYEDKKWQGKIIKRGQRIFTLIGLSEETGLTVQQIRTAIKKLTLTEEIAIEATNKWQAVTVANYSKYQDDTRDSNKQITNEQQTINKQSTQTKEIKEINNNIYNYNNNPPIIPPKSEKGKIDLSFVDAALSDGFNEWLEYKRERGERYKSDKSIKACYSHLLNLAGGSTEAAKGIIKQSIACNYAGLFALKAMSAKQTITSAENQPIHRKDPL